MLPMYTESSASSSTTHRFSRRSTATAIFNYLRRICNPSQMDFEYTSRQMIDLILAPSKVYDLSKYRKRTRNQWARDDPAFLVLLFSLMAVSAIAYGIAFQLSSVGEYLVLIFYTFVQIFVSGAIVATVTSSIANKRMRILNDAHSVPQFVEWLYAFDIHANALFPTFLILSIVQYMLLPLLIKPTYFSCLLANSLYAAGGLTYVYITHLGFRSMSFLSQDTRIFLMPGGLVLLMCAILTVLDLNLTRFVVWFAFE